MEAFGHAFGDPLGVGESFAGGVGFEGACRRLGASRCLPLLLAPAVMARWRALGRVGGFGRHRPILCRGEADAFVVARLVVGVYGGEILLCTTDLVWLQAGGGKSFDDLVGDAGGVGVGLVLGGAVEGVADGDVGGVRLGFGGVGRGDGDGAVVLADLEWSGRRAWPSGRRKRRR